ncbi:MAG: DUF692 domain-containing protein [Proteobacteria bacterium]|jgi:uncharacterized protein (UPF0276 family)|nr:DUF692 domain-containing protein [Pseudomonadota bacterium]
MHRAPGIDWVGIGLRGPYHAAFSDPENDPAVDWLEIHAENYFDRSGPRYRSLIAIADRYPISVHGVGLSLGSAGPVDEDHLERLAALVDGVGACQISEHLAWCRLGEIYYNDLLPLPLSEEALDVVSRNVEYTQRRLGRSILIENPSAYLDVPGGTMSEGAFLKRLVERTGCGLLADLNNLIVSSGNLGRSPLDWLEEVPLESIGEIHLAGHESDAAGSGLLVDTHGSDIGEGVWMLYADLVARIGPRPTIIERDCNWPPLGALLAEADRASKIVGTAAR